MNISDQEQEEASQWFSDHNLTTPVNLYYYQGEANIPWLLHATAISKGVYLNCNNNSDVTKWITSYILGKPNVWYKADDEDFVALMSYINQKNVQSIKEFLEVHFVK
jgi:tRNA G10  N-methylase Trm11